MVKKMIVLAVTGILLSSCQPSQQSTQPPSVWSSELQVEEMDMVEILDGRNGQTVSIINPKERQEIKDFLEGIEIEENETLQNVEGFSYRITIKIDGKAEGSVVFFGDQLSINNRKYEIKNEVDLQFLSKFF